MLPQILIIDDLFGRDVRGGRNVARENLCAHFQLRDVTGDAACEASEQVVLRPQTEAVFHRGQRPAAASVGEFVENDLAGVLAAVKWGPNRSKIATDTDAHDAASWALVLVDLCFYTGEVTEESARRDPGMPEGRLNDDEPESYFGLKLLRAINNAFPDLPLLVLSSKSRDEVSLEFAKRGALGFISRNDVRGAGTLRQALWTHGLVTDQAGEFVGGSMSLRLALRDARRAAGNSEHILIRGERGTGKELLARYINRSTTLLLKQTERPFVAVNAAAIASTLFASELFGILPKTASGVDGKTGLIENANGGDLFLDEIADIPGEAQAALLRVLQEGKILPVGALEQRQVSVRFLSATNAEIESGKPRFRADLLDRLRMGGTLSLPPLRDRLFDLVPLVERFVREAESRQADAIPRLVTSESIFFLKGHSWPGNIRELRSVIFSAVSRFPGVEHLLPNHLTLPDQPRLAHIAKRPDLQRAALHGFTALLLQMDSVGFATDDIEQWSGKWHALTLTWQRMLARYLAAALAATKKRTASNPAGEIQIHPAVKLLTGDGKLTATKAADLVKKTLKPLQLELDGDLAEAFKTAERLRPRSGPQRSDDSSDER